MKKVYDIMTDDDNELQIAAGDWVVDESTAQHRKALIIDSKGDWKEHPMTGVGAFNFLNDEGSGALAREIALQFVKDGMNVTKINVNVKGEVEVEAGY